jgi:endonuclease/exonuclease/phosphatase family metal-dependent hydrolase
VASLARIDLSEPGLEPRGALAARLETPAGPLRVVATHLGLGRRERRRQAARLLEALGPLDALPTVLLGDLNEWLPGVLRRRLRGLLPGPAPRTFPTRRPVFALDRVFATPGCRVTDVRAHASPLARKASDHLPLVAEVEPG